MFKNMDVDKALRKLLSEVSGQSCDLLAAHDDLFAIGVLDSFAIIEFVLRVENVFGCVIPQEKLIPQNLWSIEAILEMIRDLSASRKS